MRKTQLCLSGSHANRTTWFCCMQRHRPACALQNMVGTFVIYSLSVGHFILKDTGSGKSMRSCLVAYVNHLEDTFAKWRNLKSTVLSSTSVRKECLPKEIHEDFMETFGKESPFYSTVIKMGSSVSEWKWALRMIDGLATPKMQPLMKMSKSCTPWLCVIGGETCEA